MPGDDQQEAARRLVKAAREHHKATAAGKDTQGTEDELKAALKQAELPISQRSPQFLQAAKQQIDAEPTPAEEIANISGALGARARGPTWTNWGGDQVVHPSTIEKPTSLDQLCEIVRGATLRKERVRCVGYGHSYSDITDTTGVLIDLTQLVNLDRRECGTAIGGLLPRGDELWKQPKPDEARVTIECGARISEVNAALHQAGLAFGNLGGHVGQTVIGALATSTHGTGWDLPPLCDIALSFDLVVSGGHLVRVEPDDGITDPTKFIAKFGSSRSLIQKDEVFRAVKVSLGCLGIIYSMTVKVQGAYLLHELRTPTTWSKLAPQLANGGLAAVAGGCRHYNVLINPYSSSGDPDCVEIKRNIALPGSPIVPRPYKADFSVWAAAELLDSVVVWVINMAGPHAIESLVGSALKSQLFQPVTDQSFRVFDNGYGTNIPTDRDGVSKRIPSISTDLIFPAEKTVDAVDALLAVIKANVKNKWLQSSPLSLRWASQSDALLSPFNEGRMVSIECPQLRGIWNLKQTLKSYEDELCHGTKGDELRGRPSWGQTQTETCDPKWLRDRYHGFDAFYAVVKELNEGGVFDNKFTDRTGLSVGGAT